MGSKVAFRTSSTIWVNMAEDISQLKFPEGLSIIGNVVII